MIECSILSHKAEAGAGGGDVVVGISVRSVGHGSGEDPVGEEGEAVVGKVHNDGDEVIPIGLFGGLSLVVGSDVSLLDIEEADELIGGGLEGNGSTPGADGGDETGEHVVEGFVVGSVSSEGLVHLPCNGERSPDNVAGEGDVSQNPEHLDDTESISGPSVSTVLEEVGSSTDGLSGEINLDGSIDSVDGRIDTTHDTSNNGNATSGGSVEDWECILEYVIGSDSTKESEDGGPDGDGSGGEVPVLPGGLEGVQPGFKITPGHASIEYASILASSSGDFISALAILGDGDTVGSGTFLDGGTIRAALKVGFTLKIEILKVCDEGGNIG